VSVEAAPNSLALPPDLPPRSAPPDYNLPERTQVSVEDLALEHYASEAGGGWRGIHAEGGVWATLFGLLMWVLEREAIVWGAPGQSL